MTEPVPATYECKSCGTIAETASPSQRPNGWTRQLDIGAFPGPCVTYRCPECKPLPSQETSPST